MDIHEKVNGILRKHFPSPDEIELRDEDGHGIVGVVVSNRFKNVATIDRQIMIRQILEEELKPKERKQILIIVAVTPVEKIGHTSTV